MNKKIVLIFSVFFIFTLFIIITMIGIIPSEFEDKKKINDLSFYYYNKSNPQDVNYSIVRYLLETNEEKKKNLPKQDVAGFEKLDSTEIKFYFKDKKNDFKKTKKGTVKRIFIFSDPYYGIFDGIFVEVKRSKIPHSEPLNKYYAKDLNLLPNKTFETEEFSFKLCEAGVRGRSSNNKILNYMYIEIKQKKDFELDSLENYEIKVTDVYYPSANKKLFLETKKEVFD